jgi:hypothetical protein
MPLDVAFEVLGAEAQRAAHVHGRQQSAAPEFEQRRAADVEEAKDVRELEQAIVWDGYQGGHVFLL